MKVLILYSAPRQLTLDHCPVMIDGAIACYVRAEQLEIKDEEVTGSDTHISKALDKAEPLDEEVVLNTIEARP